jgi:hypothetical protein
VLVEEGRVAVVAGVGDVPSDGEVLDLGRAHAAARAD